MTYPRSFAPKLVAATACALALALSSEASASERRFTYTYGTDVLTPGQVEIEPWSTFRIGREGFYLRMDHRLEFEVGLASWVQTALYLNLTSTAQDVASPAGPTERDIELEWGGVSWEWKFKLTDAVADPIGVGLYVEPGIAPDEGELEAKVLLDKRAGDVYFAYNLIGEYEAEFGTPNETEHEFALENVAGLAYFFTPNVAAGLEVRNVSLFEAEEGFETSTFFAGPTVSFSQEKWWAALTVLPQLASIKAEEEEEGGAEEEESAQDLEHHERLSVRMLLGFHL
jgi:hypothetical protein